VNHYFISNEALLTDERSFNFTFRGDVFTFTTNNGLFSNSRVDYASQLLMENVPALSGSLLDIGCGYGPIGIVMAKTYSLALTMCDINETALRYAAINAKQNNVTAEIIHSDGFNNVPGAYDTILLNPPIHAGKDSIFKIYKQTPAHLNPGGAFYIVIQKKHGAESHASALKDIFENVEAVYKKKGYLIYKAYKMIN
jgi:16S rRNA (guanine1207-N2)-methyltransferase